MARPTISSVMLMPSAPSIPVFCSNLNIFTCFPGNLACPLSRCCAKRICMSLAFWSACGVCCVERSSLAVLRRLLVDRVGRAQAKRPHTHTPALCCVRRICRSGALQRALAKASSTPVSHADSLTLMASEGRHKIVWVMTKCRHHSGRSLYR